MSTGCEPEFQYQAVNETRYFDVVNLLHYNLIQGTTFMFQHRVTVGLNPTSVVIGSNLALPIQGQNVRALRSRAVDLLEG